MAADSPGPDLSASIGAKARVLGAGVFQNNGENGIVAFDDAVALAGALLPDGSGVGSTIEGHIRAAAWPRCSARPW